jgi:hypothetical protein
LCFLNVSDGEGAAVFLLVIVAVFVVLGVFVGIFSTTVFLQRVAQRHYHILAKQLLAKEYRVMDLDGLDPAQVPKIVNVDMEDGFVDNHDPSAPIEGTILFTLLQNRL